MKNTKEMSEALKAFFVKYNFDPNNVNAESKSYYRDIPLCCAFYDKRYDLVEELVRLGADLTIYDESGPWQRESYLHKAIELANLSLIQLLCENGADVNSKKGGRTPFEFTLYNKKVVNRPVILKLLLTYGAKVSPEDAREISDEELEKIYSELSSLIVSARAQADQLGKKLIILTGEGHTFKHSLLIETMILYIAHQQIQNLFLEENAEMLQDRENNSGKLSERYSDFFTSDFIYPLSKRFQMNAFAVDAAHEVFADIDNTLKIRNRTMSQVVQESHSGKNAVFIVGSAHLEGLLKEYPLGDGFHVLPINTYPCIDKNKPNRRAIEKSVCDLPYLKSPEINQFFESLGNAELWSGADILEKVERISKQYQAKQMPSAAAATASSNSVPDAVKSSQAMPLLRFSIESTVTAAAVTAQDAVDSVPATYICHDNRLNDMR